MKWLFRGCFVQLLLLCAIKPVWAYERINSFDSSIYINEDTSVHVIERIEYETTEPHHGIYRYIPEKFTQEGFTKKTKLSDVKIADEQGHAYQYSRSASNGNITFKIGDPDRTFTGTRVYIISYTLENYLIRQDGYDELYLDIVGEGWNFPVEEVSAVVVSAPTEILDIVCFSGAYGTDDHACRYEMGGGLFQQNDEGSSPGGIDNVGAVIEYPDDSKNVASFVYDKGIKYGENVTIGVKLSQDGSIVFPTAWELFWMFVANNWFVFITPLPLVIMILLWLSKGRDLTFVSQNVFDMDESKPKKLRPVFGWNRVPFVYEPLSISPGVAGYVLDEKVDHQDVVAEIIDLVRKKYLKIIPIDKKNWWDKKDYKLKKLKEAGPDLLIHQKYLLDQLVPKTGEERKLSGMKGEFYNQMAKTKKLIAEQADEHKMFTASPTKVRSLYIALLAFMGFVMIVIFQVFMATGPSSASELLLPPVSIFWVLALFFAWQMPQKTAVGTNYMLQARGLRETIKRGKWREEIKEKNLFVEEILPFAITLGVVDQLAHDMKDLNIQPPDYLDQSMMRGVAFNSFVSDFNNHTASTLSYNPSSSRSGGGGFSGGGFSGGGGGGGGGGSW